MGIKCPKCDFENPDDTLFCGKCGTQLPSPEAIPVTKTLETPKEELTTGSTFAGRYQIIEELGKGGMGKVYRVIDKKLNEEVALKLIKPEIASDKKTVERFSNELKLARKIVHKNIARMFDLNEEKGTHYITMEYVRGEDLKRLIRKIGQLSAGQAIPIAKQVCEGLAEAHRLGVVHRDLKPQNIMVDEEGNARIMDFGIARSLKAKGITGAGVMIGTPEYMSPEQVEAKETDQRSDIYSLGVILYEMVTGRVPFEGDTPFTIGMKHKGEIPKDPKELNAQIPDDLSLLILRCLEKDKEKRYQSAGELLSELTNIEKGIPTTERVVPKRKPLTSREITVTFSPKKLLIPAIAIIALVITAIIVLRFIPKKEAVFAPKIENSIAVVSFKNQTGDKTYDYLREAIPNLLITNLEQTGYFYVATWERMHDLLEQMGKDVDVIDRDLGFEVCRSEGIESIVLGSFVKAGDVFATDVKVLDVETKRILKSASSKGDGVGSILKTQIDELSKEISLGIGMAREKIEEPHVRLADVTTTSMEAYRYSLRGREEIEKLYFEEARQLFEKAVDIDPNFASAYFYLAYSYSLLGNTEARNEAIEKAKTLSQKATEKERLFIEAFYASWIELDRDKYFHILQQIAEKYPKEKGVHWFLGLFYHLSVTNMEKAVEEYKKALELDPNWGVAANQLAYTFLDMRNYEKAIEYFKRYASISHGDANPLDSMAETYFRMGRLDEAIAKYKEALEVKPDFYLSLQNMQYIYALKEDYHEALRLIDKFIEMAPSPGAKQAGYLWKGFYHYWLGNLEKSLSGLQKSAELAVAVGNEGGKAFIDFVKASIYYEEGEYKLSRKYNEAWFDVYQKNYPSNESYNIAVYNFVLGLNELKEGQRDSAKTRLNEMKSFLPEITTYRKEWITFYYNQLHTEIMLSEGSHDKVIALFEEEFPLRIPYIQNTENMIFYNLPFLKDRLALAYLKKGEIDKAITEYERLITFDPKYESRQLIHPKYHYRLAKLYEQKDYKGKAIEHYQKFLSLWKDADPGLHEVGDASTKLGDLKH